MYVLFSDHRSYANDKYSGIDGHKLFWYQNLPKDQTMTSQRCAEGYHKVTAVNEHSSLDRAILVLRARMRTLF